MSSHTPSHICILADPKSWHSCQLQMAFSKFKVQPLFADVIQLKAFLGEQQGVAAGDENITNYDRLLVRDIPGGSLEQVIFRMDVLHQVENCGVRVINSPGAIEKMVDKYYTSSLLASIGLRVPETIVMENASEALKAFDFLGGDVVLKPIFGSCGNGMVRLVDREIARRAFSALELGRFVFYLQKFIPHRNRDIRILFIGNECVAAMERVSNEWKTNISQGGVPIKYIPSADLKEICLQAEKVVGADYCGIDLLEGEDGLVYVIEVNSMPGWKGLQSVSDINIAEKIVLYCLSGQS